MGTTKLNVDGIMLFEQPFTRVPYENYRKVFRTTQKNIERELGAVQIAVSDLSKRAKSGTQTPQDATKSIDGMIGRVENLKRKVRDGSNIETVYPTLVAALGSTKLSW
jgi:macrophage erythroblast attacher